ncbi:MAG: hypothetical protein GY861_12530 [bacterium]|nr:hypothetical protein [bacterium]
MATVGEIASWVIKSQANGYNRTTDVVPIINEAHKMFMKHEQAQTTIIDPTTGRLPTLSTTLDQYEYDAPVVNNQVPWSVGKVCLRFNRPFDYNRQSYVYSELPLINTYEYFEMGGNHYYPYQFAQQLDALVDEPCKITFTRNPGDTTNRFYLLMYKQPKEILSDRIQLQIPDRDGAHRMYFFPAVMKLIEAQNNGNYMEAVEYIETVLKPKVWKVMNSGQQGRRHKTRKRYF